MLKKIGTALAVAGVLMILIQKGMQYAGVQNSITIIGGADGPTSIFLAGTTNSNMWASIAGLMVGIGALLLFVFKKK